MTNEVLKTKLDQIEKQFKDNPERRYIGWIPSVEETKAVAAGMNREWDPEQPMMAVAARPDPESGVMASFYDSVPTLAIPDSVPEPIAELVFRTISLCHAGVTKSIAFVAVSQMMAFEQKVRAEAELQAKAEAEAKEYADAVAEAESATKQ